MLKSVALVLGGSVSSPLASAVLAGPQLGVGGNTGTPRTLNPQQHRLVVAIAEAILPATETPGATDIGASDFIDLLLTEWYDEESVQRFLSGLDDLGQESIDAHGVGFAELAEAQQMALLEPLDREAIALRVDDPGISEAPPENLTFFAMMKEMTLVAYYTSEKGVLLELAPADAGDSHSGCVPLAEVHAARD